MTAIPFFAMPPVPTVSAMFCRWKLLYENGEYLTLDYEKVCAEAQRCAERLSRA